MMRPSTPRGLSVALPAVLWLCLAGCEKHQEPIGTVPADDVPAVAGPAHDEDGARADSDRCEAMIGAEREACERRQPQPSQRPVEPNRSPPPDAER